MTTKTETWHYAMSNVPKAPVDIHIYTQRDGSYKVICHCEDRRDRRLERDFAEMAQAPQLIGVLKQMLPDYEHLAVEGEDCKPDRGRAKLIAKAKQILKDVKPSK